MTPAERIALIRARVEKATKGPWRWWTSNSFRRLSSEPSGKDGDVLYATVHVDGVPDIVGRWQDMDLIEHSREDVPFLLAELDRAQVALRNIEAGASARNVNSPWDEVYCIARAALGGE